MYQLLFLAALSCFYGSNHKPNCIIKKDCRDTAMIITLEDNFVNDEINLKINNILVVRGEVISSNHVGYTDIEAIVYTDGVTIAIKSYLQKVYFIKKPTSFAILATLNGRVNKFYVNLKKGKYIGMSKKDKTHFDLRQSKTPFFYD